MSSFAHLVAHASRTTAAASSSKKRGGGARVNVRRVGSTPARGQLASMIAPNFGSSTNSNGGVAASTAASASIASPSVKIESNANSIDLTDVEESKSNSHNTNSLASPLASSASSASASNSSTSKSSSTAAPTLQCMLCGASLAMMPIDDRNRHINQCLDRLTNPNANSNSTNTNSTSINSSSSSAAAASSAITSAAATPSSPATSSVTPMKRRRSDSTADVAATSNTRQKSSSTPTQVCIIDDDDDDDDDVTMSVGNSSSSSAQLTAESSTAAASSNSSARRSIVDFFNPGHTASIATPIAPSKRTSIAPKSAGPKLRRAKTLPTQVDASNAASSTASATDASCLSSSSSLPTDLSLDDDPVQNDTSLFAAEKTRDVWNLLLTGKQTGSIVTPKSGGKQLTTKSTSTAAAAASNSRWGDESITMKTATGADRTFKLPSFKLLPSTRVAIDAFMHTRAVVSAVKASHQGNEPIWFLSHFHGDHYAGLNTKWNHGVIHCSEITSRLVRNAFGQVPRIVVLPLHERIELDDVRVTLIDAHHCPGAVIGVFETRPFTPAPVESINYDFLPPEVKVQRQQKAAETWKEHVTSSSAQQLTPEQLTHQRLEGGRYGRVSIHGGDMRYHQDMRLLFVSDPSTVKENLHATNAAYVMPNALMAHLPSTYTPCTYPSLAFRNRMPHLRELTIDTVYLDTTYCNPRYRFPSQALSIAHALAVVGECLSREQKYGVSALVEKNNKAKSHTPMKDFFSRFNSNQSSTSESTSSAPTIKMGTSLASPFESSSSTHGEGVTSFLTQATPSSLDTSSTVAATASTSIDSNTPIPLASTIPTIFDASSSSIDITDDELNQVYELTEKQDSIDDAQDADEQVLSESKEENEMEDDLATEDNEHHCHDHGEEDADLEDLMMKDYDHHDDEEEDGEDAAASSSVGGALSSMWSSVASGVSTLRSNLSLTSSFLSGYKQQAVSKTLFLVGSYSIGKEKIFIEIAKQYGLKIYVPTYRLRTMKMLELFDEDISNAHAKAGASIASSSSSAAVASAPSAASSSSSQSSPSKPHAPVSTHFSAPSSAPASVHREWKSWSMDDVLTTKITEARLHVIPLSHISHKMINGHLDPALNKLMPGDYIKQFHHVIAFRPTGWVGNKPTHSERNIVVTIPPPVKMVRDTTPQPAGAKRGGRPKMIAVPTGSATKHALSVSIHGVPYSEHSTFPELSAFVDTLAVCGLNEIIPTVSVSSMREVVKNTWAPLLHQREGAKVVVNTNPTLQFVKAEKQE